MKKILVIFGTRPEAIKLIPLIKELKTQDSILTEICITAQHRSAVDSILSFESIVPDYDLDISKPSQDLFDITINVLQKLKVLLPKISPDLVLVHGDTSTAYAAALACFYLNIKVAHIEAGLRTFDLSSPFPEEFNRRAISLLASYHFAPTQTAFDQLIHEGIPPDTVFLTGNTIVDSVLNDMERKSNLVLPPKCNGKKLIVLTLHRRESRTQLSNILKAIDAAFFDRDDIIIVFPVHPNPHIKAIAEKTVGNSIRFTLLPALSSWDFRHLLSSSILAITDSGGVQEEAAILGIPTLVIRDKTERHELVENENAILCGISASNISNTITELIDDEEKLSSMRRNVLFYGDGKASQTIVNILRSIL